MNVTGILLAAGYSSRMGTLKALLSWKGKTLIEHQLAEMNRSKLNQSIVVLGWQASLILPYIENSCAEVMLNDQYSLGKTESIKTGLKGMNQDAQCVLLINIDQPVNQQVINKLIEQYTRKNANIVIPVYNGRRGHPILFSAKLLEELSQIKEESKGLREIIQRRKDDISELEIDDPSILFNFNTIDDFNRAL
jgi:molybdenum cofactor cytidylyltransferase